MSMRKFEYRQSARWNRLRRRKERRARDSHQRWSIMGALGTPGATLRFDGGARLGTPGATLRFDGGARLMRLDDCSLYVGALVGGKAFYVHPSWVGRRQ